MTSRLRTGKPWTFIAGVVDTAEQFIAGVVDTADKHSFAIISANFRKKVEMILMDYSGARGTLIHEKNWDRKSRVRLPLSFQSQGCRKFLLMYSIVLMCMHRIIYVLGFDVTLREDPRISWSLGGVAMVWNKCAWTSTITFLDTQRSRGSLNRRYMMRNNSMSF